MAISYLYEKMKKKQKPLMQNDQNKHFLVILNYFVFFYSPGHRDASFLQIMFREFLKSASKQSHL